MTNGVFTLVEKHKTSALTLLFGALALTITFADRAPMHPGSGEHEAEFQQVLQRSAEHSLDGPFQYRILIPFLEWSLSEATTVPGITIDFFLRLIALTVCQLVFWHYLRLFLTPINALFGVVILDLFIMASLSTAAGPWPNETTEILNVLVFAASLYLIHQGRFGLLAVVLFIGTINRETTWLILPLVAVLEWPRMPGIRRFTFITLSVALPYFFLRMLIDSPMPVWWTTDAIATNIPFISPADTGSALLANLRMIAVLGPFVLAGAIRFREHPHFLKLSCSIIPVYIAAHYLFGRIVEIRLWIPLIAVMIPLAMNRLRLFEERGMEQFKVKSEK